MPVRNLSLGQRMRCELAACMLHEPEVLFLDEPTIGLDLLAKQRFRELLVRLNEERGTTIFLTRHDVADIEHVARRAIVINHGSVIYDDAVASMRRTLLSTKLVEVGLAEAVVAPDLAGVSVIEHSDTILRLVVDTDRTSIRTVLDLLLDRPVGGRHLGGRPAARAGHRRDLRTARRMSGRGSRGSRSESAAQRATAERGGVVVSVVFYGIVVSALSGVWRVAAAANERRGGRLQRHRPHLVHRHVGGHHRLALNARMIDDIGADIASGAVSVEMLRPASVLAVRVATELGRAVPRLACIVPVGFVLASLTSGAPPSWPALALAVPSIALALAANVVAQHTFAAERVLAAQRGHGLVPLPEARLRARRHAHPARGAAPVGSRAPPVSCRSAPWRTRQLGSRRATWSPASSSSRSGGSPSSPSSRSAAFGAGERRLQVVGG